MKLFLRYSVHPKPVSPAWVKRLSGLVLKNVKGASFEKRAELSVVLTGDGEVRKLNRIYRKKNKTTDVLSFPLLEGMPLKSGRNGRVALGDVVISIPQTRRQALKLSKRKAQPSGKARRRQGEDFHAELALLLTHGILHLLGYDHRTRAEEKRMFGLQDRLLKSFKF